MILPESPVGARGESEGIVFSCREACPHIFAEKQTRGKLRDYPSMQCRCVFVMGARVHGPGVEGEQETFFALRDS